jgi:hypothetical protein
MSIRTLDIIHRSVNILAWLSKTNSWFYRQNSQSYETKKTRLKLPIYLFWTLVHKTWYQLFRDLIRLLLQSRRIDFTTLLLSEGDPGDEAVEVQESIEVTQAEEVSGERKEIEATDAQRAEEEESQRWVEMNKCSQKAALVSPSYLKMKLKLGPDSPILLSSW